jgi:plastocyanin
MHRRSLLVALALAVAVLPACGGGGSSSSPPCPPAATTRAAVNGAVTVCAKDIAFDVKTITAPAGPLKVTLINKGAIAHTFKVDGTNFELSTPGHNDVKTGTVTLTAGAHKFVCTISGHEQQGMKGTIEVS